MKCINKIIFISISFVLASFLSACSKEEIRMPFSVENFHEEVEYTDFYIEPSLMASFSNDLTVISKDEIFDYSVENAGAALLIDLNNNNAVFAQNCFDIKYPASITKIMTAYLALKYGSLDDVIICSSNVSNIDVSDAVRLGLKSGDTFTLDQALRLMLLASYNDMALAVAEHISGSVEDFVVLMNEEARNLGATSTHFTNPHGLSDDEHYTTAYDLYLIFNEAIKNPTFMEIIQSKEYSTNYTNRNGESISARAVNTNQFFKGNYENPEMITIVGGKTGTTDEAGYCLLLLVRDTSGNPYISIVLEENSRDNLYNEMSSLLTDMIN